jgi:hypothetical protein
MFRPAYGHLQAVCCKGRSKLLTCGDLNLHKCMYISEDGQDILNRIQTEDNCIPAETCNCLALIQAYTFGVLHSDVFAVNFIRKEYIYIYVHTCILRINK